MIALAAIHDGNNFSDNRYRDLFGATRPNADANRRPNARNFCLGHAGFLQRSHAPRMGLLGTKRADIAGVHDAIESLLRDEFNDVALTTLNEIRREDG